MVQRGRNEWNIRYSAMFRAEPECVKILDPSGIVLQMNPAGLSILEAARPEQVVGHSMMDFIVPEDQERVQECFSNALDSNGGMCRFDVRTLRGRLRNLESRLVPLGEISDRVEVLAITRDITDLLAAEAALTESEERFRQVAERIADVFWMRDVATGKIVFASPSYEQMCGRDRTSFLDSSSAWLDCIHEDDRERLREELERRDLTATVENEYRIVRPDGEVRWIHDRTFPVYNKEGAVMLLAGIASDVTLWKETELQLRRLGRLYRFSSRLNDEILHRRAPLELLQAACAIAVEDGLLAMAWAGKIEEDTRRIVPVVWDGRVEGFLDGFVIELDEVPLGIGPAGRAYHSGAPAVSNDIRTDPTFATKEMALERGYRACASFPIQVVGATRFVLTFYANQIGFFEHEEISLLARLADNLGFAIEAIEGAEARAHREAKLRQAQKMESLGVLAGGIAHDFNNILSVIVGNLEMAKMEVEPSSAAGESLNQVTLAVARATDLVRQILTFSRRTEPERKPIDLAVVVLESIQLLRSALSKRIDIRTRIEPGLPPVSADASDIFQALMNLATNASHAMREKGGVLEVSLQREAITEQTLPEFPGLEPGGHVRLAVKDSGAGMPPEVAERIFEPFFTTKPAGEGTGLGLSVVHGIVKSHRGAIFVESEIGVGSTFEIYFPVPADLPAPTASVDGNQPDDQLS